VNVSGRISAIEIDPTDPNKVYVAQRKAVSIARLTRHNLDPDLRQCANAGDRTLNLDRSMAGFGLVPRGEWLSDSFAGVGLYRIDNVNTTANLLAR